MDKFFGCRKSKYIVILGNCMVKVKQIFPFSDLVLFSLSRLHGIRIMKIG